MFVYFSKVQARTAFAMYLVRVQQRLMADSNSLTQDDVDGLNEQMVSIVNFLYVLYNHCSVTEDIDKRSKQLILVHDVHKRKSKMLLIF